jgi:hypothetical protein
MKKRNIIAVLSALACLALLPNAQAAPGPETPDPGTVGGTFNTADGHSAMPFVTGLGNSAFGAFAGFSTTAGNLNTAVGAGALDLNTADKNTAVGALALLLNTTGHENVAVGFNALFANVNTSFSVAVGFQALLSSTGGQNTAVGDNALGGATTGSLNTALGDLAGSGVTTGSNITAIGSFVSGVDSDLGELDDSCYISNIANQPISAANFVGVVGVDTSGKLGTFAVDAGGNKVPVSSLMGTEKQAMLNRKVEELQATVAQLTAQLKEQAAQIQKVSAQLEVNKPAPQVVVNKP